MKNYSILAKYYDRFSHNDCDYESWSQYLLNEAKKRHVKTVADIACGTGKMSVLLWRSGLSVTGVDSSEEMLCQAADKCRGVFVLQDMRRLQLTQPVDMAVCVNDGVNYLKPNEVQPFFCRVAENIKQGAPFVFDVSSPYKLQNALGNNVFFVDDDDATLLWTNAFRSGKATLSLTLFERQSNGSYLRFDEKHIQYAHSVEFLMQCLKEAGFVVAEITSDYGEKLSADSLRITFLTRKEV